MKKSYLKYFENCKQCVLETKPFSAKNYSSLQLPSPISNRLSLLVNIKIDKDHK